MRARCRAKAKSTGQRCRRAPIAGGTVCRVHGGAAPQVRLAARERLKALAEGSGLDVYDRVISRALKPHVATEDLNVAVRVVRDVLDRSGFKPVDRVEDVTPPAPKFDLTLLTDEELLRYHDLTDEMLVIISAAEARKENGSPMPDNLGATGSTAEEPSDVLVL